MERLKGKTILIGKEPGQGRLLVSVAGKTAAIGSVNSVPGCVSRCKVAEGVAHAKITVDQNGTMILTNMKSQNVTYVNGSEIVSKRIQPTSTVELGKDHFNINLPVVIEAAKKLGTVASVNPGTPGGHSGGGGSAVTVKKFRISHLEHVWNDYHDSNLEIKQRQRHQALMGRIPMFFTMGSGAISAVAVALSWPEYVKTLCVALTVIGVIFMVYTFVKSKNDTSLEDSEKLLEDFQERYTCPNPDCNKFLGNMSYRLFKKQYSMHCPYCKCEYVE
ncbi:MAG: FHA domain-containing protein [Clostridium sp.]|nr:FHA domain-containing protein [Clostridium sp.]